jgi:hypothetical protein
MPDEVVGALFAREDCERGFASIGGYDLLGRTSENKKRVGTSDEG